MGGGWGRFSLRRRAAAAALAAVALVGGRAALAGDPVKLLVELPPDVQSVNCGETVDLQIVGEDASKTRVGFSGKTVEVSATYGTVEEVQQPYKFRYRTPATLPDVTSVRLRAWLKEAPEISGEITVQVIPPAPFTRLVIQGPGSTPAGASLDLLLRGETADGKLQEVPEGTVTVKVDGPGAIALVRTSRYRFDANANGSGTATVTATLNRYPKINATLAILVTGGASGGGQAPAGGGQAPTGGAQPPVPPTPVPPVVPVPPVEGVKPLPAPGAGHKPAADDEDDDDSSKRPDPVVWTSGTVRLDVWRVRGADDKKWGRVTRRLPAKGEELTAGREFQRIRVTVLAQKPKKIEVQESSPGKEKKEPVVRTLEQEEGGRLSITPNEDGTTTVIYDTWEIAVNRKLVVSVIVTHADDHVTRDDFVVRRIEAGK